MTCNSAACGFDGTDCAASPSPPPSTGGLTASQTAFLQGLQTSCTTSASAISGYDSQISSLPYMRDASTYNMACTAMVPGIKTGADAAPPRAPARVRTYPGASTMSRLLRRSSKSSS